jgi:hypothetical protein
MPYSMGTDTPGLSGDMSAAGDMGPLPGGP